MEQDQMMPAVADDTNEHSSASTKPLLRRACDCCRKRKVKCDGGEPCGPCKKASIQCAYLQPPKKKGPKGLRSARVLHALRTIGDNASSGPQRPLSPEQHGAFGNWGWDQHSVLPNGVQSYPHQAARPQQDVYGPHTSVPRQQNYYQQMPTSMTHPQPTQQSYYSNDSRAQTWSNQPDSVSTGSDIPRVLSPTGSEALPPRLPSDSFFPYIRLFYDHMFSIMPIIDRNIYLDPAIYTNASQASSDVYCFLCSICAATIVQLDESIPQPAPLQPGRRTDDLFADECLRERKTFDYIESASTLSIMTSFFLFAYYGNHEKHSKAWHYLQESITSAENLNMDDESSYAKLDPIEAQWRRRLYWLLFITERAYAVQRRKHTRLHASVQLPSVFDSEDPQLLNGFVNLANLFSAVDDNFVRAWRGSRKQSLCNEAWLAQTQEQLDKAALALGNITETQHLDISVTREWLHVLAWQMGVSNGLIWGRGEGGMRLDYPIELARKVVEITSGANALALDSHGIGMEQKLSDIAGCLADVLRCTAGDTSSTFLEGKQYLNILLQRLSTMRGKESRYLKPLMSKMEGLLGYDLDAEALPLPSALPTTYPSQSHQQMPNNFLQTPRLSMADSVGMLRTLSMSGNLGMPSLSVLPMEDWEQRRPSGKVYNEDETAEAIDAWYLSQGGGVAQAV